MSSSKERRAARRAADRVWAGTESQNYCDRCDQWVEGPGPWCLLYIADTGEVCDEKLRQSSEELCRHPVTRLDPDDSVYCFSCRSTIAVSDG